MKSILLRLEEDVFYKFKEDKFNSEKAIGHRISWEDYIEMKFHGVKK